MYKIVESQTFEVYFKNYSDETLKSLTEYSAIFYFTKTKDPKTVKNIRDHLCFLNIRLAVFSDSISSDEKNLLMDAGADSVAILPETDDELLNILYATNLTFQKEKIYNSKMMMLFRHSIEDIFTAMVGKSPEFIDVYLISSKFHRGEVSGFISLIGHNNGSVMITFRESLAKSLISTIMGSDIVNTDGDVMADGVGELVNMIAGGVKSRLSYSGLTFRVSFPEVIRGLEQPIAQVSNMPYIAIVYKVGEEYFAVQCSLAALGQR
jgi:chemotaxis protein CheX